MSEEIRHGDVELTNMFPLIDLPKYDKVTVALTPIAAYTHDLIPGVMPLDRASQLGFRTMRNTLTFASDGKVTNVRTQIRTGFNPETCSDIWVDIDNPEAPWNKSKQPYEDMNNQIV